MSNVSRLLIFYNLQNEWVENLKYNMNVLNILKKQNTAFLSMREDIYDL